MEGLVGQGNAIHRRCYTCSCTNLAGNHWKCPDCHGCSNERRCLNRGPPQGPIPPQPNLYAWGQQPIGLNEEQEGHGSDEWGSPSLSEEMDDQVFDEKFLAAHQYYEEGEEEAKQDIAIEPLQASPPQQGPQQDNEKTIEDAFRATPYYCFCNIPIGVLNCDGCGRFPYCKCTVRSGTTTEDHYCTKCGQVRICRKHTPAQGTDRWCTLGTCLGRYICRCEENTRSRSDPNFVKEAFGHVCKKCGQVNQPVSRANEIRKIQRDKERQSRQDGQGQNKRSLGNDGAGPSKKSR